MSKTNKTVFVTIENSLIDANNNLILSTVNRLKELKKEGYTIVLWSSKGRKYCDIAADTYRLKFLVDFCMSKPDIIIDSDDYPLRDSKIESPKFLNREFV